MGTFTIMADGRWQMNGEAHCRIESVREESRRAEGKVVTLTSSARNHLFSAELSQSKSMRSNAERIIRNIRDPDVAAKFDFKAAAIVNCPFRLLKSMDLHLPQVEESSDGSFIALSYCWHSKDWPQQIDDTLAVNLNMPISAPLFGALLEERISCDEGIWIDQLCINQDDTNEKKFAIGSMDIVYRKARLVVVALEDVWVDDSEETALYTWSQRNERKEILDIGADPELVHQVRKLMWKIFSARWFTPAWCCHELRVSSRHLFLISVKNDHTMGSKVLRITSVFLHDMGLMDSGLDSIQPSTNFPEPKKLYSRRRSQFSRYVGPQFMNFDNQSIEDELSIPNYMRVFAEVFEHDSQVVADKLAIVLNILGCGLYFRGSGMTEYECCHDLYHLALAAGDPIALTISGKALSNAALWMQWPRANEIVEPSWLKGRNLRLQKVPMFNDQEIVLDLVFLGSSSDLHYAATAHSSRAERLIRICIDLLPDEGAWLLDDIEAGPPSKALLNRPYIDILACALESGVDWIVKSFRLKDSTGMDEASVEALDAFCGEKFHEEVDKSRYREGCFVMLALLDGLMGLWLSKGSTSHWVPAWIQTGPKPSDRSMIFAPTDSEFRISIPVLLLQPEYIFLKRVWLVTQGFQNDKSEDNWTVRSKITSFGTADFTGLNQSEVVGWKQHIRG